MTRIPPGAVRAAIAAAEAGPAPGDLADAPVMREWSVATYPGQLDVRLHGRVEGHPEIDDKWVTTSSVLAIDAGGGEMGWARTAGRWYRVDLTSYRSVDGETVDEVLTQIARIAAGVRAGLTKAFAKRDPCIERDVGRSPKHPA